MKHHLNPQSMLAALAALPLALSALAGKASAQTTLIDWNHSWNFMHPTGGVLPAGSGATEPNSGATKWYAPEAAFAASYTGPSFTTSGTGYEAGAGAGPLGYGALDYFTTPNPAPGEFAALATTLTAPASGSRYTGYFRTTFTVPNDGNIYVNPVVRYILDDGGFVYLDGVPVLRVNMSSTATDTYTALASNTTNTESVIRTGSLSLAVGSTTGGNSAVTPAIAGNATVLSRVTSLAPGLHTLAISVHNQANNSSDVDLAVQVVATPTTASIAAAASAVTRLPGTLPLDPSDDVVSFKINVAGTGAVGSSWTVTAPASLTSVTGPYGTDVSVNAPISAFPVDPTAAPTIPAPLTITIADSGTPAVTTALDVLPPRIVASDDHAGQDVPIPSLTSVPNTGWVFDDAVRNMTMNNGGGGARRVVASQVIDLSSIPAVQFSGVLEVTDSSSGNETADSFVASLIIDGNTAAPINLITPYDILTPADGVLTGAELTPATPGNPPTSGAGTFTHNLSYIIPASANSVQIVIEGVNDSASEKFVVRDLKLSTAPAAIQASVGTVTVDNKGTAAAGDDTFGAPVTIDAINLGASPGWTSDTTPSTGLYADPQPVLFQNFLLSGGARTFTITDIGNILVTKTVTLTPPAITLTAAAAANIVRHENGPGAADDTVTFDTTITGANGGPGWAITTPGVTPASGAFGPVTLTIAAPLPASPLSVQVTDVSYPATTQSVSVALPGRYVIGQRTYSGTADVVTPVATPPPVQFINDPVLRTLEVNNAGTPEKVLESETLDLTTVGAVSFTAKLRATDSSAGSNFEPGDKVKAELIYEVGGVPTTVNLVTPYDTGDGAPSTTGTGLNGPPDGYLNGYQGAAGTDVVNATVYATAAEDYDANRSRDEFNKNLQPGSESVDATFDLAATIPANADNVKLRLTVAGVGGGTPTEHVFFTDVLFAVGVADTDGDEIPDSYETANGLNPNSAADKFLDLDADGLNNYQEYIAGTKADDAASKLDFTVTNFNATTGAFTITWSSVPGKNYRVQASTSLAAGSFTDLSPNIPASAGATTTLSGVLPAPVPARSFFSVRVVP